MRNACGERKRKRQLSEGRAAGSISENYKYLDGGDDLANGRAAGGSRFLHVPGVVFSVIGEQAAVTGAG